ncbi:hypothetical protein EPO15_12170 [bacterium]|nr:MAG: hypothetical protein EPO15_12170 [bacterium]
MRGFPGAGVSALLSVAAAALFGYSYGASSNHAFWLPAVLERLTPGLYAGDPAVAAALRGPTFFYDLLAATARLLGTEAAALTLWTLSAAAVGALAWAAGARRGLLAGALAALFVALSGAVRAASPWAGDPLLKAFADHTSAAWPFVLGGAGLWLSGRAAAAWVCVGVSGLLNPLCALLGAGWLLAAQAWEERAVPGVRAWGEAAAAGLAGALLLTLLGRGARPDLALALAASPNTYLPSTWPWERWVQAVSWAVLWWSAARAAEDGARLRALTGAGLLLGLAGLLAPWLGPLAFLQPLRLDAPLSWLGAVAAAAALAPRLTDPRPSVWLAAAAAALALVAPFPGPLLPVLAAAVLAARTGSWRRGAAAVLGLYGLLAPLTSLFFFMQAPVWACLAVLVLGAAAALAPEAPDAWPSWVRPCVGAAALSWGLYSLAPAARLPSWREAPSPLESAARDTPPSSRLAASPDRSGLRLRGRRPVCAEWTDFNLGLFDRAAAQAWAGRMGELGVDWERLPAERAKAVTEWDRAFLRRRRAPPAEGVPGWTNAERAYADAKACGAAFAAFGGQLLPI